MRRRCYCSPATILGLGGVGRELRQENRERVFSEENNEDSGVEFKIVGKFTFSSSETENGIDFKKRHYIRVAIDNVVYPNVTLVDSARKHRILLEAVQVITDLNLSIKKAYISSDGKWFMDVFHVTDLNGNKLEDESVINYMEQSLSSTHFMRSCSYEGVTALELTGTDRVGLLSEVFAVLADLNCSVVDAKVWTQNGRIASLLYVKDCESGCQIEDSQRIRRIEAKLRPVLKGYNDLRSAKTIVSMAVTHRERRLHQMMFDDHDYERTPFMCSLKDTPMVSVHNWNERGYSVVNVQCNDRPKLLFDCVCTLTDIEYSLRTIVFITFSFLGHPIVFITFDFFPFLANKSSTSTSLSLFYSLLNSIIYPLSPHYPSFLYYIPLLYLIINPQSLLSLFNSFSLGTAPNSNRDENAGPEGEFYIKHTDGTPISSDAERQRVVQCLQAAIQRRASQGVRLELYDLDRSCLLANVTQIFREHGLNIARAEISTSGDMALNIFYVTDVEGNTPNSNTIDEVCEKIGSSHLKVKGLPFTYHQEAVTKEAGIWVGGAMLLSLGSLVRKNLHSLGLIRSYS